MATSGTVTTNVPHVYRQRQIEFSWTQTSQSAMNNSTTISWSLYGAGSSPADFRCGPFEVTINGTQLFYQQSTMTVNRGTQIASGSYTIYHDSNGEASISITVNARIYYNDEYGDCVGWGTFELNKIDRWATVTQSVYSKTETSITMYWTSNRYCDSMYYSYDGGSTWVNIGNPGSTSGYYQIGGLDPNRAYSVKTRCRNAYSGLYTDTSAVGVATYSYPYAVTMPDFTIGELLEIRLFNPLDRNVTVYFIGDDGTELEAGTVSGTRIEGFNTDEWKQFIYLTIPGKQSAVYSIKCVSIGQEQTRTGGTYTINVNDCTPSIGSIAYEDTNSVSIALTENNQDIIRNRSTVKYTASGLTVLNSATIASVALTVNGITYSLSVDGTTATGGDWAINSASNVEAVITLTDSRGLTDSKSIEINMLDWTAPTAIISLARHNNFYSETDITINASYAHINGNNQITITYKAKKKGTDEYTINGVLENYTQSTFTADNNYDWDVVVTLVDSLEGTTVYNLYLSRGMPIIYFDRLKSSVGINCFPQGEKTLEVNGTNVLTNTEILFTSLAGETDNITLSKSIANYTYIEIYFTSANSRSKGYTKAFINGNSSLQTSLSIIEAYADGTYIYKAMLHINGDTANTGNHASLYIKGAGTESVYTEETSIKVNRIVGYA